MAAERTGRPQQIALHMDDSSGEGILQTTADDIGIRRYTACTIEKDFIYIRRQLLSDSGDDASNTLLIVTNRINTHCLHTAGIILCHLRLPLGLGGTAINNQFHCYFVLISAQKYKKLSIPQHEMARNYTLFNKCVFLLP